MDGRAGHLLILLRVVRGRLAKFTGTRSTWHLGAKHSHLVSVVLPQGGLVGLLDGEVDLVVGERPGRVVCTWVKRAFMVATVTPMSLFMETIISLNCLWTWEV